MQFSKLFDDDRAVSPVIGVILMVAITVILAAVIGTFVLGLGDQVQSTTPQASFGFDFADANEATITHESGDTIDRADLKINVGGDTAYENGALQTDFDGTDSANNWDSEVSSGDSVTIVSSNDESGDTVRVIYDNPNADSSSTLASQEWP